MKPNRIVVVAASLALLVGCAGRDPRPVALVQPHDAVANCSLWLAEANGNNAQLTTLASESGNTTGGNVALGVVGAVLFWPALFAMDFKGAADKEAAAINNRQQFLATMLAQHRCTAPVYASPPQQPPRA